MTVVQRGNYHAFEASGQRFVYLSTSAAVVAIDSVSAAVLDSVAAGPQPIDRVVSDLADRFDRTSVEETVLELARVRALEPATLQTLRPSKVLDRKSVV